VDLGDERIGSAGTANGSAAGAGVTTGSDEGVGVAGIGDSHAGSRAQAYSTSVMTSSPGGGSMNSSAGCIQSLRQ